MGPPPAASGGLHHHHRASLKQTNKSFKSKHRTKGDLKGKGKSTPDLSTKRTPLSTAHLSSLSTSSQSAKSARRNHAKQIQNLKRSQLTDAKRLFSTNGSYGIPKVVCVVPLYEYDEGEAPSTTTKEMSPRAVVQRILEMTEGVEVIDSYTTASSSTSSSNRPLHAHITPRHTLLQFVFPPPPLEGTSSSILPTMNIAPAADFTFFLLSPTTQVSSKGENLLRCLQSVGIGEPVGVVVPPTDALPDTTTESSERRNGGAIGSGAPPSLPMSRKDDQQIRKSLQSFLSYFFPSLASEKIHSIATPGDVSQLVRLVCEKIPSSSVISESKGAVSKKGKRFGAGVGAANKWREWRSRLVSDREVEWEAEEGKVRGDDDDGKERGTLRVTGTVRGIGEAIVAGRFVSLGYGWGEYMVTKTTSAPRIVQRSHMPPGKKTNVDSGGDVSMSATRPSTPTTNGHDSETLPTTLTSINLNATDASSDIDDLTSTRQVDQSNNDEQTWPTEDEIADAPANKLGINLESLSLKGKRVRKVPKGTSEYQAEWILSESEDDDDDDEDEEEYEPQDPPIRAGDSLLEGKDAADSASVMDTATVDGPDDDDGEDGEEEEEEEAIKAAKAARARAASTDASFPDEVDTPMKVPALQRFARFRGLKNFRSSDWDPMEGLPGDYGKIYDVTGESWRAAGRRGRRGEGDTEAGGHSEGDRVTIHLHDVPKTIFEGIQSSNVPLVAWGLFKHEHKFGAMHWTVQRNTEFEEEIKSKDTLIVIIGPRAFRVNPLFSQNTQKGRGTNNVHKYERFFRPGSGGASEIATAYLPITIGHLPTITLRERDEDDGLDLVGSGTLLGPDASRIIAKRAILTGYPYKVHKKTATIRYMFFDRQDVEYFQPIQLKTKKGRTGFIKEPLGTHGLFKAGFDGTVDQMDTVCLCLYKRVWPRWGKRVEMIEEGEQRAREEMQVE